MPLTPKQEAFALAYVETGNASEAYRYAYDAGNMKLASVNRKAKELLGTGKNHYLANFLSSLLASCIASGSISSAERLRWMKIPQPAIKIPTATTKAAE